MAKYFTGIDGALLLDGQQVAKIATWSFNAQTSSLETTTLGKYAREYVSGIQSFSGSAVVYYYTDDNGSLDGQRLLNEVIRTGPPNSNPVHQITLQLQETPPRKVTFKIVITSASLNAAPGELVSAQISFVGSEPLLDASLAA